MAINSAIKITDTDFDNIRTSLKEYLSSQTEFKDYNFDASVISMLIDLLAYNTYHNSFYLNMVANETFLDSALIRNNVISRAKMLGYTPRSAQGAKAILDITFTNVTDSPDSIFIKKNTTFTTTLDGVTYTFVTPQNYEIVPDDNSVYSGTIEIVEGEPLTHRYTVSTTNPERYIIPNKNVDTQSLRVTIQNSEEDDTIETYTLANDITEVNAESTVYFLNETFNEEFEIYFGDDIIGKKPQDNNIVIIEYRITNGKLLNDISTFTGPSKLDSEEKYNYTIDKISKSSGGGDLETIDSIKFNAPKNFNTQNRAVLAEDYRRLIIQNFGDIESVNVWGGEENTPAIYGKVYIAAKPYIGTTFSNKQKDDIKKFLKKYNVMSIDIEFVDASYLYILPTIQVNYDDNLTNDSAATLQQKVITTIENFETNEMGIFEKNKFRLSKFMRNIDNADKSIVSNRVSLLLEKRFVPTLTKESTYTIVFNNSIEEPLSTDHVVHEGTHAISSSDFMYEGKKCYFDDNGEGIIRIYTINKDLTKIYLNKTAGTIDYINGIIKLDSFLPTSFSGNVLSIFAIPAINDINAIRNQIMLIGKTSIKMVNDNTEEVTAKTINQTTLGVETLLVETGITSIVI